MLLLYNFGDKGNTHAIKQALENGAKVDEQDNEGYSTLMHMVGADDDNIEAIETLKLLLQHKANPNLQRDDGSTSLMMAVESGAIEMVKMLLVVGANKSLQSKDGRTIWFPKKKKKKM